jgi:hypothetical protein
VKIRLAAVVSAALTAFASAPAPAAQYNNEIDVGVLSLFIGNMNAGYERNLNGYVALVGRAGFMPRAYIFISDEDRDKFESWRVVTVSGGAKLFPLGEFRRLYVQGEINVDFHSVEEKDTGRTGSATVYRPGAVIGWRWVIAERATLTVGGGSDYVNVQAKAGDTEAEAEGIWPRVDFNLGFLF